MWIACCACQPWCGQPVVLAGHDDVGSLLVLVSIDDVDSLLCLSALMWTACCAGRPWWCGQPAVLAGLDRCGQPVVLVSIDDVDSLLCLSALMMWIACCAGQPWWCRQPVVLVSLDDVDSLLCWSACQPWHDDVAVGSWQDWIPLFRNLGVSVCYYETGDVDTENVSYMSGCLMQPHLWFPFRIIMERGPPHGGCHCGKKASYFLFMI